MPLSALEGKRVAIMGFGAEGQAALALLQTQLQRCRITILEERETGLEPHRQGLAQSGVDIRSGTAAFQRLDDFDIIIKSPGITPYRAEIVAAMERGVRFTSGTQLWCDAHPHARLVIVTGTKGKSTTASLIAHLLNAAGRHTELIGNIGKPALEAFSPATSPEFWVMELSSYQATGLQCHAEIALLLNLFPEHTDWHGSTERYYRDKTEFLHDAGIRSIIVEHRKKNIPDTIRKLRRLTTFNSPEGIHVRDHAIFDGERLLLTSAESPLPGLHNLQNICAALTVVDRLGLDPAKAIAHLASFRGLPHRLFSLGEKDGVEYVDDSISTTPQSALAALNSFPGRACTQLLGGYDRDLDWREFAQATRETGLQCVVTLPDNGEKIAAELARENPALKVIAARDMADAVEKAASATPAGGVVILSPGAPSYGHYRDFRERGLAFARCAGFEGR